jgi:hypothetical protein
VNEQFTSAAEVETETNRFPEQSSPSEPEPAQTTGEGAPETGDLVIDAALRDLADTPDDDLDAQIERGEQVQRTLQGRLSDLGG